MQQNNSYIPPKVWAWNQQKQEGNRFANINRPTAGSTFEKNLPVGNHPLQLYSLGTPNGMKVTILLEELLGLGISKAEYDAWLINIMEGDQFSSGFVEVNPNSKIPALVDHSNSEPVRVFESGAIIMYLAEKYGEFLPEKGADRAECLSWIFWQMGATPYLGGGFGHFYAYAPEKLEYPIERFTLEVKRQLDLLDRNLEEREYICGDEYTIADLAIYPWYGGLALGKLYESGDFLEVSSYKHLQRWTKLIKERPAVKRGQRVNRIWGNDSKVVSERHDASDLD